VGNHFVSKRGLCTLTIACCTSSMLSLMVRGEDMVNREDAVKGSETDKQKGIKKTK